MEPNWEIIKREEEFWESKTEFDWITKRSIKAILENIPEPQGNCLELCSGSGMFTKMMNMDKCEKYTCLDLSQNLLNKLKLNLPNVATRKGDAQKLSLFQDNSFEYVYIYAGLHHLPELDNCFSESYRVLKPKGKWTCFEPNEKCFYRWTMLKLKKVLDFYTKDEVFLDPEKIIRKLETIGFKNIRTKYITPNYKLKHIKWLYPLFIVMKLLSLIPAKYCQTFFIINAEKQR